MGRKRMRSPGRKLPHFPELRLHHAGGADEAAEARAIRAEDDRHVAGEIDRADGVGVVVDVRRMQAGLAAVAPGPIRLRPDQAHAGAGGVVMHLPLRGEKGRYCSNPFFFFFFFFVP